MSLNYQGHRKFFILILLCIAGFTATYFLQFITGKLLGNVFRLAIITLLFLFSYLKYGTTSKYYRALGIGSLFVGIYLSLKILIQIVHTNILHPGIWDFLCFFMHGQVAARGLNFYDPGNYAVVLSNINLPYIPGKDFITETINEGFLYFPPNIFNFLFLGYFDFNTAHILWIILNILCLSMCIFLVWQLLLKNSGVTGFIFTVGLFLLLPGTQTAMGFEHNTFIFMIPLLLAWKFRDKNSLGIWLAIGFCLKPILAVLFIFPLLQKKWKTLLISISSLIIISVFTIIAFGSETFFSFFIENPLMKNTPQILYIEWVNQSLLATILRLAAFDFTNGSPLFYPPFLIAAAIISLPSFYMAFKLKKEDSDLTLALIIIMALLLYPGSINSYSPLIIPLIGLLINYTNSGKIDFKLTIALISFIYCIMLINPFISHLTVWVFLLTIALMKAEYFKIKFKTIKLSVVNE